MENVLGSYDIKYYLCLFWVGNYLGLNLFSFASFCLS